MKNTSGKFLQELLIRSVRGKVSVRTVLRGRREMERKKYQNFVAEIMAVLILITKLRKDCILYI